MKIGEFLKDKLGMLLLQGAGMLFLGTYLLSVGNPTSVLVLILSVWVLVLAVWCGWQYAERKRYFGKLQFLLQELDQRYLLAEVMPDSWHLQDQLYREILRKSNKSVIEKIHQLEAAQSAYKEYIEGWIHEVKTPLTAMHVISENLKQSTADASEVRRLQMELGKMENQVEQVLYYARMERTYQDYLIAKTNLRDVVLRAIRKNRLYLMENQMQIDLELEDLFVSTDGKWVLFLLNQFFSNAIKYRRETQAQLHIFAERQAQSVSLVVEDNGCGIKPEELGRIFQKGFSGTNGRRNQSATGMGLYLCRQLCEKLDIGLSAQSEEGVYTRMILTFPDSGFSKLNLSKLKDF